MTYFASENALTEQDMAGQPGWIEIDAAQHQAACDALLAGLEVAILDGAMVIRDKRPSEHHEWEDGEWVDKTPDPEPLTLAAIKDGLKAQIDADAEAERLKYVTPGAGQAMEYQQAAAEADELLTAIALDPDYEPLPETYPMLAASIGIDGGTLAEVAATVAAMHGQWRQIGSAIRAARLAGKAAIDAAATAEDAQAAFDAVEWPAVA